MGTIRRVGVVGAGVMGSGIAAHMANAGMRVVLLDILPPDLKTEERTDPRARNRFALQALERTRKNKPAAFMHRSRAGLVTTGNTEDDLGQLADCDLIIEAIIEKIEPKQALFAKLEKVISPEAIVASNTSGLGLEAMLKGRSESFRKRFLVMHFFNPVRYMKLLELVAGPDTDPAVLDQVARFGRDVLGKGIVVGKDTPNFVGNRIGAHAMMAAIQAMLESDLTPEDVDQITGPPMAHPKTASFRTADLVGLDTFAHVVDNCYEALPDDEDREIFRLPNPIRRMIEKKLLGNKTKAGFYRKTANGIETLDFETMEYRPRGGDDAVRTTCKKLGKIADPGERIRALVADESKVGTFAWQVLARTLAYSARRIGEIADSVKAIDDAMRWGYNWELGPFEMWDALGFAQTTERLKKDGHSLPAAIDKMLTGGQGFYTEDGKVYDLAQGGYVPRRVDPRNATLQVLRKGDQPVLTNDGAEAWDLGDGVLGVTFKTKANSIDSDVISMLSDATERAERDFRAMVIANQGTHFCVGANLFVIVMAANQQQWDQIEGVIASLQAVVQKVRYSRVPVVAAPFGMALGGGLEVCLSANALQAAAETYSGLVEVGVGLIPAGGGTMNLMWRALSGVPEGARVPVDEYVAQVFKNIALAKVATSADEAKELGYFQKADGVSFDRARLLTEAKARAIGMAESGYHPPVPRTHRLPGESGIATLSMMVQTMVDGGHASEHDALIARKLAHILCGGVAGAARDVTEDDMLELEREAFISLCGEAKSLERMQYMLMNNKPLRN